MSNTSGTKEAVRSVPFFNYPWVFTHDEKRYSEIFADVCRRGAYIMQRDLEEFETELAELAGVGFAIGVANCTDGLMLALRAAGIGAGDEVIFSSHTMTATAAAIHFVGAVPVPADCLSDHLIDPTSVQASITERTKAIMPTHLNGRTCAMDPIMEIAEANGLIVVEDAAQALGSTYRGKGAGAFGIAGAVSFYPAKTLGCFGDAGAVLTNTESVAQDIRSLRDHGRNADGETVMWGLNSRLDNVQAAFLIHNLRNYSEIVRKRRALAALYDESLRGIEQVVCPPGPDAGGDHFDVFQNYEIEATKRDELRSYLGEQQIGTLIQWGGKAVHQIESLGFSVSLPQTEAMFERCLMLPLNLSLTEEDVHYVVSHIKRFYEARV